MNGDPCDSQALELKASRHGRGVYVRRAISEGEQILEFHGALYHRTDLPSPYTTACDYYLQVGPDLFMGPSGGLDDFINHSCDPNCGIRTDGPCVVLTALRPIALGEELTFDYSTTNLNAPLEMTCHCGSKTCRRTVRDFQDLPPDTQARYVTLGVVPAFILAAQIARSDLAHTTHSLEREPWTNRRRYISSID